MRKHSSFFFGTVKIHAISNCEKQARATSVKREKLSSSVDTIINQIDVNRKSKGTGKDKKKARKVKNLIKNSSCLKGNCLKVK